MNSTQKRCKVYEEQLTSFSDAAAASVQFPRNAAPFYNSHVPPGPVTLETWRHTVFVGVF